MIEEDKVDIFMNHIIKTKILVDDPIKEYIPYLELKNKFNSENYFNSIMLLSCLIESNIRTLALIKSLQNKLLVIDKENLDKIPLSILINWVSGEKIPPLKWIKLDYLKYPKEFNPPLIGKDEKDILIKLKNIRNDIAHCYYLTYDKNLRKELIKEMIDKVNPIHNKLIEEINRIVKEQKSLNKKPL